MSKTKGITLGQRYRDAISGFEGVATARYEYLYGCIRICLEGEAKDGKTTELVFDEQRLTGTPKATSGGPRDSAPISRGV